MASKNIFFKQILIVILKIKADRRKYTPTVNLASLYNSNTHSFKQLISI